MLLDVILQQEVLEIIVVTGIAIVILGLFWRVIIIGIALLFSVIVLANHAPNNPTKQTVVNEIQILSYYFFQIMIILIDTLSGFQHYHRILYESCNVFFRFSFGIQTNNNTSWIEES